MLNFEPNNKVNDDIWSGDSTSCIKSVKECYCLLLLSVTALTVCLSDSLQYHLLLYFIISMLY